MKYAQVPLDTFQSLVVGAGVIASEFNPATGVLNRNKIIGPTNGGINFHDTVAFKDFAEGIDNLPRNTKEFKRMDNTERQITVSGTFKAANPELAKRLMTAADISGSKITPRADLKLTDFSDLWIIADYSDDNTGDDAGMIAIHLINVLHTGGFQLQTQNADLGDFAFEFMAHYTIDDLDAVPYEVYIAVGGALTPYIELNTHYVTVASGSTVELTAVTEPEGSTVTWASGSSSVASVSNGTVTGGTAGNTIITASITEDGVTYNDTCTVVVTAS